MARATVAVRCATDADLDGLLLLWAEMYDGWGRGERLRSRESVDGVADRFRALLVDPDVCVLLAVAGADAVGMSILSGAALGPLSERTALQMSYVVVTAQHRRRGVGRALVVAAAAYADEHGYEQVMVNVRPNLRDANRFYARLGFAPLLVRRAAPVSQLRRRLAVPERRQVVEDVVRRRTMARLRPLYRPPAVGPGSPPSG